MGDHGLWPCRYDHEVSDPPVTTAHDRVDRARETAVLDGIDADVAAVDAAMRLAHDGDLDAAEAVADQLESRAPA